MARTFYSENLALLKDLDDELEVTTEGYFMAYVGSAMALDPCGRYHHILSPNGATARCMRFWESLDAAADRLGGWIEASEGDPTDMFFCEPVG